MKRAIEDVFSLASGAALGAAIMYLFDPATGRQRRESLGQATGESLSAAGQSLGSAWETMSDRATATARAMAARAKQAADSASDTANGFAADMTSRARGTGRRLAGRASDLLQSAVDEARAMLPRSAPASRATGIAAMAACALGSLALGIGAVYLLDRERGQKRRQAVRDRLNGTISEMGRLARATGEHLHLRSWNYRAVPASVASKFPDTDFRPDRTGEPYPPTNSVIPGAHPHAADIAGFWRVGVNEKVLSAE